MKEIWKEIIGCGPFEISNLSRLRKNKRILTTPVMKNGYVGKYLKGVNKNVLIHRAVAIAFIPNPQNFKEVNHLDGNKLNNSISNLEWTDRSGNAKHAVKIGLMVMLKAEECCNSKLTNNQVFIIREAIQKGFYQKDIANYFKLHPSTISRINIGSNWKSI